MRFGLGARGEGGEAAQVGKEATMSRRWPSSSPSGFRPVRRLEVRDAFQAIDAFRLLFRDRNFSGHLVEARGQLFQFVTAGKRDAMIELSDPDPLCSVLQFADRPGHARGETIGQCERR